MILVVTFWWCGVSQDSGVSYERVVGCSGTCRQRSVIQVKMMNTLQNEN